MVSNGGNFRFKILNLLLHVCIIGATVDFNSSNLNLEGNVTLVKLVLG